MHQSRNCCTSTTTMRRKKNISSITWTWGWHYLCTIQCNLDIRNPGYKEQLGYKELFSEFFFYVMGFLAIRNKFGIFPKLKNLDIRNDFQGKCNHFDQYFTETPLRVLFVMICNLCVCCFWWVIHHPPTWHHQKNWQPHLKMGEQPWVFNKKPKHSLKSLKCSRKTSQNT